MRRPRFLALYIFLLLLFQFGDGQCFEGGTALDSLPSVSSTGKQILFLNTFRIGLPIPDSIDHGILTALNEAGSINGIFIEHLDLAPDPGGEYRRNMADLLRHKLAGSRIGVVIAEGTPAIEFLEKEAKGLFPDVPLITLTTPDAGNSVKSSRKIIDIPWQVDPAGTLKAALDLFPKTRKVLVVTGANDDILPFLETAEKAFAPWKDTLEFEYTNDLTYEQMMQHVSTLPKDAIIIYSPFFSDTTGRSFVPAEVVVKLSKAAGVPVFATLKNYLGHGIVGGSLLATEAIGRQAGKTAIDYLQGRLKLDKRVTTLSVSTQKIFDWNELNRWKAKIEELPGDAAIINRPATLLNQYREIVIAAGIAFFSLGALIIVLWLLNHRLERLMLAASDSEARFKVMMEYAPEAIIVFNPELRKIIDANPKAAQLFGCAAEKILQEDPERLCQCIDQPNGVETMHDHCSRALKGGEVILERVIRTYDGREVQCEIRLTSLPFQGQQLLRSSFIDITERKQAEEALRRSEARFRTLVQAIPDLVWLKDKEGVFLSCNQMFERLLGAREEDIVGKTDYDFVDRELADFFRAHDRKAIEIGKPISNEEWVDFMDDGRHVLLETIKTPMYDNNGKLIGVLGIGRNITERKSAEEERVKLETQLQRAHRLEAIGQLAGGVAHDFNNMLGVILGYTELAMEQIDRNQPVFSDLTEIRSAANRSTDITRQLLAFARKQTVTPVVVDLNETLESMLKMLRRLIGEDVNLSWRPGNKLWPLKIDPSQIDQILANLCVNARGAICGVGKIIVETGNSIFDEEYCSSHANYVPGEYVRLTVSDTGCGMSKETMNHIFEPFFTTKAAGSGTGLGLATVYGIVKQNNGFINVYSELGQGTTFTIYLPKYYRSEIEKAHAAGDAEPVTGGHEIILLVEDEPTILVMAKTMLQRLGYKVLAASGPYEAIRIAEEFSEGIDLLITDVIMPEMNGRDLVKRILAGKPGLKHLFMSGYTADIISRQGVLDETVCFIQKPFSKNDLAAKVRQALHWEQELNEVVT